MAIVPNMPTVLCSRECDKPPTVVVPPGVRVLPCVGCRARVFVSPSTLGMVREGRCQPVCHDCLPDEVFVGVMTAEQLADLRGYVEADPRRN